MVFFHSSPLTCFPQPKVSCHQELPTVVSETLNQLVAFKPLHHRYLLSPEFLGNWIRWGGIWMDSVCWRLAFFSFSFCLLQGHRTYLPTKLKCKGSDWGTLLALNTVSFSNTFESFSNSMWISINFPSHKAWQHKSADMCKIFNMQRLMAICEKGSRVLPWWIRG